MSLEFATGDSTQPNGGLSHTGTPKPGGKQLKALGPFSWDLGTPIDDSENIQSIPFPLHRTAPQSAPCERVVR